MNNFKIKEMDVERLYKDLTKTKNSFSKNKFSVAKNNKLASLRDDNSIYISNFNGDENDINVIKYNDDGSVSVENKAFLDKSPSLKEGKIQKKSIFKPENGEVIPSEDLIYISNKRDGKSILIFRDKDNNPNTILCKLIDENSDFEENLYYSQHKRESDFFYRAINEAVESWLSDTSSLNTPLAIKTLFENRFHCKIEQSPEIKEALDEFSSQFPTTKRKEALKPEYVQPKKRGRRQSEFSGFLTNDSSKFFDITPPYVEENDLNVERNNPISKNSLEALRYLKEFLSGQYKIHYSDLKNNEKSDKTGIDRDE